ncbi:hypothetical protein EDB85DRAFT_2148718 [Lactarius pseudohatsudake]|nr:hypothetical protein EDB85DRAFT_2148718 [Lactarius pseudohatsudake]
MHFHRLHPSITFAALYFSSGVSRCTSIAFTPPSLLLPSTSLPVSQDVLPLPSPLSHFCYPLGPLPLAATLPSPSSLHPLSLPFTSCNISRCASVAFHPSVTFATFHLLQHLKMHFRCLHPSVTFAALYFSSSVSRHTSIAFTPQSLLLPSTSCSNASLIFIEEIPTTPQSIAEEPLIDLDEPVHTNRGAASHSNIHTIHGSST